MMTIYDAPDFFDEYAQMSRSRFGLAAAGEEAVSKNLLVEIDGDRWIDFRRDSEQPAALVTIHPGPMTPEADYAPIIAGFFETIEAVLPEIPQERIYMTVSEIHHWGWGGRKL